jgi:hypothetical protein
MPGRRKERIVGIQSGLGLLSERALKRTVGSGAGLLRDSRRKDHTLESRDHGLFDTRGFHIPVGGATRGVRP